MSDMRPPPRAQVAQLVVTHSGHERRGSGYLVGVGTVLTAAHVVDGAESVLVRFEPDLPGERTAAAVSWRSHPHADFAVVEIEPAGDVRPAAFGRVSERAARLRGQAVGFPRWKLRRYGAPYRDAYHAVGEIAVLSNFRSESLEFLVPAPPAAATGDGSPWEGMSGAAVWVAGRIVGVVSEHHPGDGLRRLTVARLDLAAESGWALCTLPAELGDVAPLSEADRVIAAYRAAVADTAPAELVGRSAELAELAGFAAGDQPYAWWQAGPWAGKSALLSWFVLHPPDDVDVAAFFVSRCLVGESDSDAFLKAMIEQLAVLAGESPGSALDVHERRGQFLRLLAAAAAACATEGRRLVLVVDGLDEDTSSDRSRIATLLPQRLPAGVRVLIASRPDAGLQELLAGHPLGSVPIRPLAASAYGEQEQITARNELDQALRGAPAEREVLGLVTVSGGGLSLPDLRELTGRPAGEMTSLLAGHLGRTIDERGSVVAAGGRGYAFTHETLREISQQRHGEALEVYWERLRAWAAGYRDRGWPTETPGYLLHSYPRLLATVGDLPQLVALATDQARHERLLTRTGGDCDALTEIATAAGLARHRPEPDLAVLLRLALARHGLVQRNRHIPVLLPALWAELGQADRAVALANSIGAPDRRTDALCRVAANLTDARRDQVLTSALEAVGECDTPVGHAVSCARLAAASARADDLARARELIDTAEHEIAELVPGDRLSPRVAVVVALVVAGEHGRAADLAVEATRETAARVRSTFGGRAPCSEEDILTLHDCASVLSAAGFPDCAARLAEVLRAEARYFRQFRTEKELADTYRGLSKHTTSSSLSRMVHIPVRFVGGSVSNHVDALDLMADTIDGRVGGLAERARDLAHGQPSQGFQQAAMVAVVESLVAHGELDQAEQLAQWGMTGEHAAQAQAVVAAAMMPTRSAKSAELAASAEATARKAGPAAYSDVRTALATEFATMGDRARADRLAPRHGADVFRPILFDAADALAPLGAQEDREAVRLAQAGAYRRAERLVCPRGVAFPAAGPIAAVAAAMVRAGEFRRAEQLFKRAHLSVDRGGPMAVYAAALAAAGRRRAVIQLEKDAFFPDARFQVLVAAAQAFANAGDARSAGEFAERAGAQAREHSFPRDLELRYLLLARIWATISDRARAEHLVRGIRDPANRIAVLAVFAITAARAGDVAGAAADLTAARAVLKTAQRGDQYTAGLVKLATAVADCQAALAGELARAGLPTSRQLVAEALDGPGWLSAIPVACTIDLPAVQALADTLVSSRPGRRSR